MIYTFINLYKKVVNYDNLQVDNTASAIIKNNNLESFMYTTRLIELYYNAVFNIFAKDYPHRLVLTNIFNSDTT